MIKTAIDVVRSIRKEKNPDFFDEHDNRYCISVRENDLMVSYMFSTPIRREKTNKVVDLKWHKKGNAWETFGAAEGSTIIVTSAHVIITKTRMQYKLYFPFENDWKNEEQELRSDCISIVPTTNGIMVSVNCTGTSITKFTLESRNIKDGVQKNSQYIAFMGSKFKPEVTLASLFYKDISENISPVKMLAEKDNDLKYNICFETSNRIAGTLYFEFNIHEEKLFQDTTVSEERSLENNAFGSVVFLGNTNDYGEERFYIKLMLNNLYGFIHKKIKCIKLHIPRISTQYISIEAHKMDMRFCSFGSTWEAKKPFSNERVPIINNNEYIIIDLTEYMAPNGRLKYTYGLMLKKSDNEYGTVAFPTGDSCAFPLVLLISYER